MAAAPGGRDDDQMSVKRYKYHGALALPSETEHRCLNDEPRHLCCTREHPSSWASFVHISSGRMLFSAEDGYSYACMRLCIQRRGFLLSHDSARTLLVRVQARA